MIEITTISSTEDPVGCFVATVTLAKRPNNRSNIFRLSWCWKWVKTTLVQVAEVNMSVVIADENGRKMVQKPATVGCSTTKEMCVCLFILQWAKKRCGEKPAPTEWDIQQQQIWLIPRIIFAILHFLRVPAPLIAADDKIPTHPDPASLRLQQTGLYVCDTNWHISHKLTTCAACVITALKSRW